MKKIIILFSIIMPSLLITSCEWDVVDSNGLLITDRSEAYMSFFDIVGTDNRSLLVNPAVIDTIAQTVDAVARHGTNLTHVKPYSGVVTDAIVEPGMGSFLDFSSPREYTVISGDREIEKTYTITITVQE